MRYDKRCYNCLLSRVLFEAGLGGATDSLKQRVYTSSADMIQEHSEKALANPVLASIIHRHVYAMIGCKDPYKLLKEESNRIAQGILSEIRPSLCSFHDYVLACVIGNLFDYGVKGHTVPDNFHEEFQREFSSGLTIDETDKILSHARRVVYFTDNCGEIVFDALVLQYLHEIGSHITLVLRDEPILNDATMEDALSLGLDRVVDVLTTTGAGCELGFNLSLAPPDLKERISGATLIISKGMANYESFTEYCGLPPVAYLMAAKCEPIAELAGVPKGSKIAVLRI